MFFRWAPLIINLINFRTHTQKQAENGWKFAKQFSIFSVLARSIQTPRVERVQ